MTGPEHHQSGRGPGRSLAGLGLWVMTLGGLTACGGGPSADTGAIPAPPVVPAAAPSRETKADPAASAVASAGFTPLPTPQQVEAAMPPGRVDPFAPLAVTQVRSPRRVVVQPPLNLPDGFRFNGVISSGGRPMALVQFGDQSGSLAVGDAGGRTTDLLPEAWRVASIDVQRGRLTLVSQQRQAKGQVVVAEL